MISNSLIKQAILCGCLMIISGCDKFDFSKSTPAPGPTPIKVQTVQTPSLPEFRIDLNLGKSQATTQSCFCTLYTFHSDRPNIFRAKSYQDSESETFPSAMINSQVTADSLDALSGQTISADVYVMLDPKGPAWHSLPGEPVSLKILSTDEKKVRGEFVGGNLVNSATGERVNLVGNFIGLSK
jgi:hypothetical protein